MTDTISVEELEVGARIGVYDFEKGILQKLVIDVRAACDVRPAAASDALEDSLDYDKISRICRDVCTRQHHDLIETVAEKIAASVKESFQGRVSGVEVRVAKPGAVPDARTVAVHIRRTFDT